MRLWRALWRGVAAGLAALAILALVALIPTDETRVSGAARVIDGDSLVVAEVELRLKGLDAPELAQSCERGGAPWPCGLAARDALRSLVAGAVVTCRIAGRDRYGRGLARCEASGRDLGAALVRGGHALANGDHQIDEALAWREGLGLWAGRFERPDAWRRAHPRDGSERP